MAKKRTSSSGGRDAALKRFLDDLVAQYHRPAYLATDPLEVPREYDDPADREVAAFFAAALAYGRIDQIKKSTRAALGRLGPRPAETLGAADPKELRRRMKGVKHRFNTDRDLALLGWTIGEAVREVADGERPGSLGEHFRRFGLAHGTEVAEPGPKGAAPGSGKRTKKAEGSPESGDIHDALVRWTAKLRGVDAGAFYTKREMKAAMGRIPERASFHYLIPRPELGSASKRLHLFLRWMIRPDDGVDLGLWSGVADPASLLIPVDTHVGRIARNLGLATRRDNALKTSREITANLRRLAPDDPTRYDFSLARLGILQECPTKENIDKCRQCQLIEVCELYLQLKK